MKKFVLAKSLVFETDTSYEMMEDLFGRTLNRTKPQDEDEKGKKDKEVKRLTDLLKRSRE